MAAVAQQIADSLTQDEIPIKLRCASCNKLVINAFRLPCCDQNVCESCQTTLPESCPVCMHSPLSADDCKPNKSLRLTVKAFLKNEEKKRDKLKAEAAPPPTAVAENITPQADIPAFLEPAPTNVVTEITKVPEATAADDVMQSIETEDMVHVEPASKEIDSADSSLLETCEPQAESDDKDHARDSASIEIITGDGDGHDRVDQSAAPSGALEVNENKGTDQLQNFNGGLEVNGMNNGFSGFNPMMMQNGMNGMGLNTMNMNMNMNGMNGMSGWGGFPNMMGMNMDPSMMMFGNGFNGQGMGFNGMNMNMNMGMMSGYDSGYGNWGSQSGMNGGDYGGHAGYYPNSGYNQQSHRGAHFNSMSQRQPSHTMNSSRSGQPQGFPQKAPERTLASQDRGAGMLQSGQDHAEKHQQDGGNGQQTFPEAQAADKNATVPVTNENNHGNDMLRDSEMPAEQNVDNINVTEQNETRPASTNDQIMQNTLTEMNSTGDPDVDSQQVNNGLGPTDQTMQMNTHQGLPHGMNMAPPGDLSNFMPAQAGYNEFYARGRGAFRARGRGRGGFGRGNFGMESAAIPLTHAEPVGTGVVGAPTGPKSMRAGAPVPGFRGRGGFFARGSRGGAFSVAQNMANGGHVRSMTSAEPGRPQSAAGVVDAEMRSRSGSKSPSSRRRRRAESSRGDRDKHDGNDSEDEFGRSTKRRKQSEDNVDAEKDVKDAAAEVEVGNVTLHTSADSKSTAEEPRPASRLENQPLNEEEIEPREDKRLVLDEHNARDGHDSERSKDSQHHSRKSRSSRHDRERSRDRERSHERSDRDSRRRRHHSRSRSPRHDEDDEKSRHRSRRHRSRSRSPRRDGKSNKHDDTKSSHRSHRDHDRERDRAHRDKDSKRDEKHRDRDYDRDREHKSSRREHDRDREQERPRSSRASKDDVQQSPVESKAVSQPDATKMPPPAPPPSAPTGPRGNRPAASPTSRTPAAPAPSSAAPKGQPGVREFKIQGRSKIAQAQSAVAPAGPSSASRSDSVNSRITKANNDEPARRDPKPEARAKPAAPAEVDPHTLEREARNRERMLKEAQRMSLLMNRGDGGAKGGRKGSATARRRGSKVGEEDAEARARRVEQEREAQRWS